MARSITKGKGWPLNIIESASRSWATSRILESLERSLTHSWPAFRYQSAMLSIRMGFIWILWLCQAWARITTELGRQEDLKEDEDEDEDEDYLEELPEQPLP